VAAGGDYLCVANENQERSHLAIKKLFVHEVCNQSTARRTPFQECSNDLESAEEPWGDH
jgi:hypothetical protein